jgi:hypothetical protein
MDMTTMTGLLDRDRFERHADWLKTRGSALDRQKLKVSYFDGAWWVFGPELATLRLYQQLTQVNRLQARWGRSVNMGCWYVTYENEEIDPGHDFHED